MFVGLRWMYRRNSNFIDGVGNDARFLAGASERASRPGASRAGVVPGGVGLPAAA